MKKISMYLVVAVFSVVSCGRDEEMPKTIEQPKKENAPLNDFTLEKTDVFVKKGTTERIKITSGNGDYDYQQTLFLRQIPLAIINLSADKQYLEITALQDGGTASTHITDVKSGKRIRIMINTTK
ncbi:MAG: hypothetical protein Q4A00_00820 [Flavobacteriaceae bacterium]|nr:hypothetical protein [Flavobacteriaceae bacterium]